MLTSPFLAGAEGLEPSARGFGVDVGEHNREQGKAGVARFPPQVGERVVLVWCCGEILRSQQQSNCHRYNPAVLPDLLDVHSGQQFLFRQGRGQLLKKLPVGGDDLLHFAVIPLHFGGNRLFQAGFEMLGLGIAPRVEGKPVDTGIGEQLSHLVKSMVQITGAAYVGEPEFLLHGRRPSQGAHNPTFLPI